MLKFVIAMIIPVLVFRYTLSFGGWLSRHGGARGKVIGSPAYMVASGSLALAGYVLWKMMM